MASEHDYGMAHNDNEQDSYEPFGPVLKEYRVRARLSQGELGRRAELDHSTVSRFESGSRNPERETVEELSAELELNEVEKDHLIASARFRGYGNTIPPRERELREVLALLNSDDVPEYVKEYIRRGIALLVAMGGLAIRSDSTQEVDD